MYKKINYITAVLVLLASISVNAQVTLQSPYSKYGVGNLSGSYLPQFRAMGGVSTAINKTTGYDNINIENPASYAGLGLTTIDVGMSATFTNLTKNSSSEKSFNSTLSHIAFAFPVSKHAGLSFGILPYSSLGYNFINKATISSTSGTGNPSSSSVNNVYSGEGGLTKAYMGYGYRIGDHFRIGANVEYLFGNLIENRAVEPDTTDAPNTLAARLQNRNSVGGVTFSYGAQYDIVLDSKTMITIGYSGSSANTINSRKTFIASKYIFSGETGVDNSDIQTIDSIASAKSKFKLPLIHNFGIAFQKTNKWVVGADFRLGQWSKYTIDNVNQGLQNTMGASIGGQITPDLTSINNYWSRVDYRFGLSYDKTYVNVGGKDVKQMSASFGLGLPLSRSLTSREALYKMNFTTEYGKRGTMTSGELQENYLTLHLGFVINDRWFKRFKFD